MNEFIFERAKFQQRYNCTFYNVDSIPVAERQHDYIGLVYVTVCPPLMFLYLLCLLCIWISEQFKRPTYKLMFIMGMIHISGLTTTGLLGGLFYIRGDVYCSSPLLIYITGALDVGVLFFVPVPLFNSYEMTYVPNPHVGYFEDATNQYIVVWGLFHNSVDFCVSIVEIVTFLTLYHYKRNSNRDGNNNGFDHQMFIQVLLIHLFQLLTSVGLNYIRLFPTTKMINFSVNCIYLVSQVM
ncbi:unnamed protein product [Bursaphelenchus okinawaensis]|uniref:Uncharacterized protein n=1 Tax=Bursaphelenchus okinawaensis TaxID=465554 RepID=A0A811L6R8_9BILA|nr:unnamed protein product [Bursaphelenchus okinawaensis]CAG9119135.1 unnamed protein product [Bursaphelenchus okinawaensis]